MSHSSSYNTSSLVRLKRLDFEEASMALLSSMSFEIGGGGAEIGLG